MAICYMCGKEASFPVYYTGRIMCGECWKKTREKIISKQKEEAGAVKGYSKIEVTFKNGHSAVWEAEKGDWDDYTYEGPVFAIKKNGVWVGIYNMDCVFSIVVK